MKLTAFILALSALAIPASAQTFTPPPAESYLSPTVLNDSDGDGILRFTTKRGGIAAKQEARLCADYVPRTLYVRIDKACPTLIVEPPVTPPVVMPPPVVTPSPSVNAVLSNGESFMQTDDATIGLNAGGGLGSFKAAPSGFRTDQATGLLRAGWFVPPLDDFVLQGRVTHGFGAIIGGVRYANFALNGLSQIPGGFTTPTAWQGAVAGIEFREGLTLVGKELAHVTTLTNRTAAPVAVTYFRSIDPDQSSDNAGGERNFSTVNRVLAAGSVEAGLYGGGTYYMLTDQAGARIARTTYNAPATIGTTMAVGSTRTADDTLQLVFASVTIQPGGSVAFPFREGVKDVPAQ